MVYGNSLHFISDRDYDKESAMSKGLFDLTGYYADDYIYPVKKIGNIFEVWTDESEFKEHYCVSLAVVKKDDNKLSEANTNLHNLAAEYNLKEIHFNELMGCNSHLKKEQKADFAAKYIKAISPLKIACFSIAENRNAILKRYGVSYLSREDIMWNLFWENFKYMLRPICNNDIFLIHKERDNNYSDTYVHRIHEQLYIGVSAVHQYYPDKYFSVCMFPQEFMKTQLLKSSVSDFVAYASCKIQNKLDKNVPKAKVKSEYEILLKIFKESFILGWLSSPALVELIHTFS